MTALIAAPVSSKVFTTRSITVNSVIHWYPPRSLDASRHQVFGKSFKAFRDLGFSPCLLNPTSAETDPIFCKVLGTSTVSGNSMDFSWPNHKGPNANGLLVPPARGRLIELPGSPAGGAQSTS